MSQFIETKIMYILGEFCTLYIILVSMNCHFTFLFLAYYVRIYYDGYLTIEKSVFDVFHLYLQL